VQIQLNTDRNIHGDDRMAEIARGIVTAGLGSLAGRLTRVEVHLQDVNGHKGGPDDIRCAMEARPEGLQPLSVTETAASVEAALKGATAKLRRVLESTFGKHDTRHPH